MSRRDSPICSLCLSILDPKSRRTRSHSMQLIAAARLVDKRYDLSLPLTSFTLFWKPYSMSLVFEHCTREPPTPNISAMDRTVEPGLEVEPSTGPQVAAQPDEHKYYIGSGRLNHPVFDQSSHSAFDPPNQSNNRSQTKSQGHIRAIGFLIVIVVLLLAVALGVGLGVGLSVQHRQHSSK